MQLIALSVFDSKAEFFAPPFYARTKADGRRSFLEACNDSQSSISQHPEDFKLYVVGSFDDASGLLVQTVPMEFLVDGAIVPV